jgi:3-phytase
VDSITLPSTFALRRGGSWTPCAEEDDELPQVEGMVADSRRGFLFAAQEDVGIWRIAVGGGTFGGAKLFDRVREFGRAYTRTSIRMRRSSSARSTRTLRARAATISPPTRKG